ncbi:MAG: translation elongation factor Ts [Elusimicrobia bacterium]|nr:translation elongation factor Ts [Elusimicrobiota bacterium]
MSQMELIQKLREMTGAGMMDCKEALQKNNSDIEKAVDYLRQKGKAAAAKKASRDASEGIVYSYIHPGDRIGVLVEVNCETDFVARTDEFKALVKEIAMQIAAADPRWIKREEVKEEDLAREREIIIKQMEEQGKPQNVIEKAVEGKLSKFYSQYCLMEQAYIRDDKKSIKSIVDEAVGKTGENIQIARFARYELGR